MKNNYAKKKKSKLPKLFWMLLCAFSCLSSAYSQKTITGTVTDQTNGYVLPGVSVVLKGERSIGTITDINGIYQLSVPSNNSVLEFTFLGFKSESILVGNRQIIDIAFKEDTKQLDEIVVVGYGVQKRVHMTGAVSQITSAELMKAPMQNVSNMLTGKISGLTSMQRSGKPGSDGTTLYVRGQNSFAGSNGPMVIVDGVPRPMDQVNPNDIESISVLKDAAAAIYGVQGANGVILITTKTGGEGPAKILYDGSFTATTNTAMPEMLNAADYMYWHNKARTMDNLSPLWNAGIQNKVMSNDPNSIWGETDWLDKIFRTGLTQQHNVSASGGSDKAKYFASIGIMDQEGTMRNTSFTRYNMRVNVDIQVAKKMKFIANLAGYRSDTDLPGTSISNQGEFNPVRQAINAIPIIKSEYQGMYTAWNGATYNSNGYAALNESGYKSTSKWDFTSNFKLEYDVSDLGDVLKGLKASVFGSYNYENTIGSNYDRYYQLYAINMNLDEGISGASGYSPDNVYTKSTSWGDTYLFRPQIDYSREFDKHFVGTALLYEARRSYSNTMTGRKRGYYSDNPVDINLGTTDHSSPISGSHKYLGGLSSWLGRFNYAYNKKYMAEFAFRYDGSYKFAPENRWGFFPSASVGWMVSEEDFFANTFPSINYLKIRSSYGQSGSDNVTPYLFNSQFKLAQNSMVLGNTSIAQFYSDNAYIYRNLTWASTHSYNLGIDLDMWNQKLGLEFNLFYKLTKDILEEQKGNFPTSLGGYYPSYQNSGKVENKGFEITLKHHNRINSDWTYSLKGDFAFARNRVLSQIVGDNAPNYRSVIGRSINTRWGFQALSLFQTQQEIDNYPAPPSGGLNLGDIKYADINGDGRISADFDYVETGYGDVPEINFTFNMDLSYKNFYLSMLWQGVTHTDYELSGVYGTGVTSSTVYTSSFPEGGNSPYYRIEGAWTPENTEAKYPRLSTASSPNNAWRSSWWVVNGEYFRLKSTNIGYNLPEKALSKTPFTSINIYLAGTNLLTFSHFKYIDPESPSVSNGYYPQQKTYSMGMNITF